MQSDDLGLAASVVGLATQLERMSEGATYVADGHVRVRDPVYLIEKLKASAAAIERLVAERDEALASKTAAIAARELASGLLSSAEAQRDKLKEALQAMVQRFELYLGPDNIHAGRHDLALVQRARQALKDAP